MKYLALVILLMTSSVHAFDANVTAIVDGRVTGGAMIRQLNILEDGRNLHDYRWSVSNIYALTYIDFEASGPPLQTNLVIDVQSNSALPVRVAESITYRMENQYVQEMAKRKTKFNVTALNFDSTVDFGMGDHQMSAVGDGRFDIRGIARHDDPILCEVVGFHLHGKGLFDLSQDDNIIPTPYNEPPVIAPTVKSRMCPWVSRDADGNAVIASFG